jgi:hypothetical protein
MSNPFQPGLVLQDWRVDSFGKPQAMRAESRAGKVLAQQIERYLRAEVSGRSCLIAGSRGSGKTTLIQIAYEKVRDLVLGMRPIVVRLHGPSLLIPSNQPAPDPDPKTPPVSDELRISESVLRAIVINLYQTAAEEFATAYRRLVTAPGRHLDFRDEALERAAQLRLTLDGAPGASLLRDFWESIDALESGVLFDSSPRRDQGLREIAALTTAAEAYRSCTGEFKRKDEDIASAGRQEDLKLTAEAKGKELGQALVGIVSALAVGGAAKLSGASPLTSAISGAITAVLSIATLTYTNSFTREASVKQEITFLPDLSATGLVHRIPLLLTRLRQAGIVPIFVIDELDKLASPAQSLDSLVANLKFLCADQAFFCFLTDRAYLSEVVRKNRDANTALMTVFTDTLFVLYETWAFRKYLTEIIRQASTPEDLELRYDIEALQLVLIHRSQTLAFNLVREIADVVQPDTPDRRLKLYPKEPRTDPTYKMFLVLQLAVEVVLRDKLVAQRIQQDPDFGQILYDALYYPTKRWYQGRKELDCSQDSLLAGIAEMYAPKNFRAENYRYEAAAFLQQLEEDDKKFLHSQVQWLLALICDPDYLQRSVFAAEIVSRVVCDIVKDTPALLTKVSGEEDHYEWKFNRYGITFDAADVKVVVSDTDKASNIVTAVAAEMANLVVLPALEDIRLGIEPRIEVLTLFEDTMKQLPQSLAQR